MIDNNSNYKRGVVSSELPVRLLLQFRDGLLKKRMFAVYKDELTGKKLLLCSLIVIYRSSVCKNRPYSGFSVRFEKG